MSTMSTNLTENEKRDVIKYLEAGKPLPDKYRFLLYLLSPNHNRIFREIQALLACFCLIVGKNGQLSIAIRLSLRT